MKQPKALIQPPISANLNAIEKTGGYNPEPQRPCLTRRKTSSIGCKRPGGSVCAVLVQYKQYTHPAGGFNDVAVQHSMCNQSNLCVYTLWVCVCVHTLLERERARKQEHISIQFSKSHENYTAYFFILNKNCIYVHVHMCNHHSE